MTPNFLMLPYVSVDQKGVIALVLVINTRDDPAVRWSGRRAKKCDQVTYRVLTKDSADIACDWIVPF